MEEMNAKTQMAKIRNFEKGFMAIHLINIGAKLGILEKINEANENGITVSRLSDELDLFEPYLNIWCKTAYHLEILDCNDDGRFKFQPFLNEILGDRNHFRNYLANITADADFASKEMLAAPEYYRAGKPKIGYNSKEMSEALYDTTRNIPLAFLFMILPKNTELQKMLEKGINFLDIGCGNGNLIIQLAKTFINSKFWGIGSDLFGIEVAEKNIIQSGLSERVKVEHISGQDIPFKNQFDLASMVVTLHEILPTFRKATINKTYDALKPGGSLLILDFPYPETLEDFKDPIYDFGIMDQFFELSIGSVHLGLKERKELLNSAGFKNQSRMAIGKGLFDFVIAEK